MSFFGLNGKVNECFSGMAEGLKLWGMSCNQAVKICPPGWNRANWSEGGGPGIPPTPSFAIPNMKKNNLFTFCLPICNFKRWWCVIFIQNFTHYIFATALLACRSLVYFKRNLVFSQCKTSLATKTLSCTCREICWQYVPMCSIEAFIHFMVSQIY